MADLFIRSLTNADADCVHALLSQARDATMFLRSNIRSGGFAYEGKPRQAKYFGAFDGERLVGVAALCWNGVVLVYAPCGPQALFVAIAREATDNGPAISGFSGPTDHLFAMRGMLDLGGLPISCDVDADLFALNLAEVRTPDLLEDRAVSLRRPCMSDLPILVDWQIGYRTEAFGDRSAAAKRGAIERATAKSLERGIDNMWLLERDGALVSRSIFTARLPGMVQIGGVWTPPHERGKGYGRTVVAGSLRAVAQEGIERAVLVGHDPQAIRAYTAIGFEKVGADTLVMFAEPLARERTWGLLNASPFLRPMAA